MKLLAATLIVAFIATAARADELHATAPRSVDFAGGLVVDAPFAPGTESLPGLALDVRWFVGGPLWLAAGASFEAGADLRDPERGELTSLVTAGLSAGVHRSLSPRFEVLAGARLEGVRAEGWPMTTSGPVVGVRGGPQAALAVMLGRAWGHPMSLEARASWLVYRLGDSPASGWQAGLHLVGVLFPDR